MQLRKYQTEAVEAVWRNLDKQICVSLPTGSGKSLTIAELIRRFLEYPDTHILLLTHKRELIRQNADTLGKHLPIQIEIGIFCAGLRRKELKQVTVASVQSLVNAEELPPFEIIIIDEVHLVGRNDQSQYHKVFARFPDARKIGLTATPFRMDSGLLYEGEDRLFEALVYEAKTGDLIEQGYLSPIISKQVSEEADLSDVHIRCGDFKSDEMAAVMDTDDITNAAVKDVLTRAAERKSILIFCAGVEHAYHVEQRFRQAGQESIATITEGTTMYERDELVTRFKTKDLRILVSCAVFTTGFDSPNVDCVVLLRATKSPGLYVQIVGRGLRKAEGKTNCLLLDYGGNIMRHGPIDEISVLKKGEGPAPVKTCPECASIISAGFKTCPDCGYVFEEPEKKAVEHDTRASEADPIRPVMIQDVQVKEILYTRHSGKPPKPDSLKVTYVYGLYQRVSEWVCVEHGGYAQEKAQAWFARRGVSPMPSTVEDALYACGSLAEPHAISIKTGGKFPEIVRHDFSKLLNKVEEPEDNLPF